MTTDPVKLAIKGTTQEHLPIEDIVDSVVILKDGSCSMVMRVSSVNFDLLSEREQEALVYAYGGILNSLTFPIQVVINSTTKDVSKYQERLRAMEERQENPLLKDRIVQYRKFIEETVKRNDVLSKTFYVVVPFSILSLGIKSSTKPMLGFLPMTNSSGLPYSKEYILDKAKSNLEPKRDHLMRLFARLGLETKQLDTKELIKLFYRTYNEETAMNQNIESFDYQTVSVTTKK
jgi:hypothetical protein